MKLVSILASFALAVTLSQAHAADAMKAEMPAVSEAKLFPQTEGAALYQAACQACHMPEGLGATAAASYPALARDPRLKPKLFPIVRVLNGSKAMPSFKTVLSNEQIVAVVDYVRTHFGNRYNDKISLDDVKALRQ